MTRPAVAKIDTAPFVGDPVKVPDGIDMNVARIEGVLARDGTGSDFAAIGGFGCQNQ
jgi:hypothetical protein